MTTAPKTAKPVHTSASLARAQAEHEAEQAVAKLQATVEGVVYDDVIEYGTDADGKPVKYRLAQEIGHMPMMKFAHYAEAGVEIEDPGALAAFYETLCDCFDPDDWRKLERALIKNKAKVEEDLMPLMQKAMEIINARPTQ